MTEYEKFVADAGLPLTRKDPFLHDFDAKRDIELMHSREGAILKYGFAILTETLIESLKKYAPIVEVGAGLGYWAYEFQKRGVDYIPTEPKPLTSHYFKNSEKLWAEMETLSATEAVIKYPDRAVLYCWPSYSEGWAAEALRAYTGSTVIYVGESHGGCTADDDFHEEIGRNWKEIEELEIPQWFGIHDRVYVYSRK